MLARINAVGNFHFPFLISESLVEDKTENVENHQSTPPSELLKKYMKQESQSLPFLLSKLYYTARMPFPDSSVLAPLANCAHGWAPIWSFWSLSILAIV